MFTGIVEEKVPILSIDVRATGARLELDLGSLAEGVQIGDSIAIDGCCLTVVVLDGSRASFDAVPETLSKTTLGERRVDDRVNVERSMRLGDRLGGHLVTGHVDGVGQIVGLERTGDQVDLTVEIPEAQRRYVVEKGSITLDGISLTVAGLTETGLRVAVIPHTLEVTTLGDRAVGQAINVETDVLGKWVGRLLAAGRIEGTISLADLAGEG